MSSQLLITFATTLCSHDHWDGPGPWWPIIPLLWFAVHRTVIVAIVRAGPVAGSSAPAGSRAGESRLAERFAAGEITSRSTASGSPSSKDAGPMRRPMTDDVVEVRGLTKRVRRRRHRGRRHRA